MQVSQHGVPECDLFVIAPVARPLHLPGDDEVGLFENPSPENPNVVLVTEEGDGRFRGSE